MIWDAMTGQLIDTLKTVGGGWSVEFSPNGRLIASTCFGEDGEDKAVMIWDATTHRVIRTIRHPNGFKLFTFSPDGRWLAATEDEDDVTIIEVVTGKTVQVLRGHTGGSHRSAYSRDGRYLAVACGPSCAENYGSVKIWDVAAGRDLRTLEGHTKTVWGVAYSPDGRRLASASFDHKVKIWDPSTGQEALTLHGHTDTATAVAFSPDGHRLASASEDGTIRIWDASPITEPPARELLTLSGHTERFALWRTASTAVGSLRPATTRSCGSGTRRAADLCVFSGDTLIRLRAGVQPGRAADRLGRSRWESPRLGRGDRLAAFDLDDEEKLPGMIMGIAYSPDGVLNFATAGNQYIDIWDATTGKHLRTLPRHEWMIVLPGLQPRRPADRFGEPQWGCEGL